MTLSNPSADAPTLLPLSGRSPRFGGGSRAQPEGRARLGGGIPLSFWIGLLCSGICLAGCSDEFEPHGDPAGAGGSGAGSSTGGSGGEGGQGGSGGSTPAECIPSEATDAVGANCGVFVSSSLGDDAGNDGSRDKPFATVKKALEKADAKRIYVCAEQTPLAEDVLVERAVELYGGLDCGNGWVYDAQKPTRIATAAGLVPMRIQGVAGEVEVEDFDLAAADAVDAGGSSVGMFVESASDVTLRRVNITAGTGKAGTDAVLVPFAYAPQTALNGNPATPGMGGLEKTCVCGRGAAAPSIGGKGGDDVMDGQDGEMGLPNHGGGAGGTVGMDCVPGLGKAGSPPAANGAAGPGAAASGSIDPALGWVPEAGAPGVHGAPGQGGGGGASDDDGTGAGGGGGCGGCGGAGGPGGGGGGASIALLVRASNVTAQGGTWTAQAAGAGGSGIAGQQGQTDVGDGGDSQSGGCDGGSGATGAAGGPGGGGAGGVSAAVVSQGTAPVIDGTELVFEADVAAAGAGGTVSNAGAVGVSIDSLELVD